MCCLLSHYIVFSRTPQHVQHPFTYKMQIYSDMFFSIISSDKWISYRTTFLNLAGLLHFFKLQFFKTSSEQTVWLRLFSTCYDSRESIIIVFPICTLIKKWAHQLLSIPIICVIRYLCYPSLFVSIIVVIFVICCLCYPLSFIVVIFIIRCLFHLYQKVVSPNSQWIHNFCHLLSSLSVIFVIHYSCYQLYFYPLFFPFVSLSKSSITNFFADRQFA